MIGPKVERPTPAQERTAYELVTVRDRGVCVYCGSASMVERDHRLNRSQGGRTVVENLALLCRHDHIRKTHNPAWAIREGLAVPAWADPAEWPAQRRIAGRLTWVIYMPDIAWFDYPTGYRTITPDAARQRMQGDT